MTDWDRLPDRVELFDDADPHGSRMFVVGRVESGVVQLLDYYGSDYGEAILVAESIALAHGVAVFDRVANPVNHYEVG